MTTGRTHTWLDGAATTALLLLLSPLLVLLGPARAEAYVDPTGGGFLLQLVLGGGTAVVLLVRIFLRRLAGRLGRRPRQDT